MNEKKLRAARVGMKVMDKNPGFNSSRVIDKSLEADCDLLNYYYPESIFSMYPAELAAEFNKLSTKRQRTKFLKDNPPIEVALRLRNNNKFYSVKNSINFSEDSEFKSSFYYAEPGVGYANVKTAPKRYHVRAYISAIETIYRKGHNLLKLIEKYPTRSISVEEKKLIAMFENMIRKCHDNPAWAMLLEKFNDMRPHRG